MNKKTYNPNRLQCYQKKKIDSSFWLASGGEDNAITINWLSFEYDSRNETPATATVKSDLAKIADAHASSVTGTLSHLQSYT
jgi:hypothetical protein